MNTPPNIFLKNEVNYIRLGLSTDIFKIKPWKARPNNDISTLERYKDYIYRVYVTSFIPNTISKTHLSGTGAYNNPGRSCLQAVNSGTGHPVATTGLNDRVYNHS